MKLITLGTSHGDPGMTRFNSALLLRTAKGDYLFEAGPPVNAMLIRKNIPFAGIKAVFVSHTHEDHTGGLPGLVKSLIKRPEEEQHTRLLLPEQSCADALRAFVDSTHRPWTNDLISTQIITSGKIYDDGNLRVTAFRTDHMSITAEDWPSWAFLAEAEGKRIVFTGDLSRDLHDFPLAAFEKEAICVMECQHYRASEAGRILKDLPVSRFIGVHISNYWDGHADKFYKEIGSPSFPFAFAEDGMEFDLSSDAPDTTFTAAVLADLHLSDTPGTIKEKVLNWALEKISSRKTDAVVMAGDMTGSGTLSSAKKLKKKLQTIPHMKFFTPGNAELRCAEESEQVLKCLATQEQTKDVLLLDSARGKLSSKSRKTLLDLLGTETKNLLIVTHYPPMCLPEDDQALLNAANRMGIIGLLVYGHLHYDKRHTWQGIRCEAVRGMDPDKAIGAVPGIAFFTRDQFGHWMRKNESFTSADPARWSTEEKREFLDHLGLSAMSDTDGGIDFAAENKVPVLELRFGQWIFETEKYQQKLANWRKNGGRTLSIHFPDFSWDEKGFVGRETLEQAVRAALQFGADRVTCHVPRFSVKTFADAEIANKTADTAAELLRPLAAAEIAIGIENLHMRPGEKADDERGFGYTPGEVFAFIQLLKERGIPAGLHFDIGHARNNAPYSQEYNVSDWLTLGNQQINGMHLHQVTKDIDGKFLNHQAITEPFGKLISLASLFAAWQNGDIPHIPLILEIRKGKGPDSLFALRNYLS